MWIHVAKMINPITFYMKCDFHTIWGLQYIPCIQYIPCLSCFTLISLTHSIYGFVLWCLDLQKIYNINTQENKRKLFHQNYVSKLLTCLVYILVPFSSGVALYPLKKVLSPLFTASNVSTSCQVKALLARTQKTYWTADFSHFFWGGGGGWGGPMKG